jgi:hypothetical protein
VTPPVDEARLTRGHGEGVPLRLAYRTVTNTFAVLRLLPMSDRDKDVEILALRHQLALLHATSPRVGDIDARGRAFLAALLQSLPRTVLRRLQRRRCVQGAETQPCIDRSRCQMARASSVNAAATRSGADMSVESS